MKTRIDIAQDLQSANARIPEKAATLMSISD